MMYGCWPSASLVVDVFGVGHDGVLKRQEFCVDALVLPPVFAAAARWCAAIVVDLQPSRDACG